MCGSLKHTLPHIQMLTHLQNQNQMQKEKIWHLI